MECFEDLFQKYSPLVYRFLLARCRSADLAEELTAETFYRAYLHMGKFRGECSPETWLCQIAKNALIKEQKRRNRSRQWEEDDSVFAEDSPLTAVENGERLMALHKKLHTLQEPYREVFMLRIFGELAFKQIAAIFGKSESWAKVTFYRAKEKIVERMEEEG